ncbi:ABC transporter ATP-binding protein [Occultella aeris]|uniref:Doxorubicin resistance ATP-binding protein DrrA n=1 Tax=Occultella aeris TaxID=2761496 RepID=A0A7M4DE94_9MICO|nr:ABC transporter ATP-binding protein [Occultella aeris]VZO35208.1 Doxorubicin resistance ATP-binding protein DrrA [Occultella aeris]
MEPIVSVRDVRRSFGDVVALDGVSLDVHPGEIVGLLGPNGAGKTTLLSLINGLRKPDSGTVRLFGGDPRKASSRFGLGTTPQETGLPATLRVGEVIDFVGGHYADPMGGDELLDRFDLRDLVTRQSGGLSGGQKRRLAVALSLVGRPSLVLLDEPTTGLDVEGRRALWRALRDYHAEGSTIILTSHYLEEVEALAERVVVVGGGRILADDRLDRVLARVNARRVSLRTGAAETELAALPTVTTVQTEGDHAQLLVSDSDAFVRGLVTSGTEFSGLEVRGASLEEAFLSLTDTSGAPETEEVAA